MVVPLTFVTYVLAMRKKELGRYVNLVREADKVVTNTCESRKCYSVLLVSYLMTPSSETTEVGDTLFVASE
jgi:hypothetical protein